MPSIQMIDNPQLDGATLSYLQAETARAAQQIPNVLARGAGTANYAQFLGDMVSGARNPLTEAVRADLARQEERANAISKAFRHNPNKYMSGAATGAPDELPTVAELAKSGAFGPMNDELAKSVLDVGTLTNMANVVGGQALGYFSLDTQLARGTVQPDMFTLYLALNKSAAFQVVDYWAYIDDQGGGVPGTAFAGFGGVTSGALVTNVGLYIFESVTLRLLVDGRAMSVALASQNSFIDIATTETANAALNILSSVNYACYYGNSAIFPNEFNGLATLIPSTNVYDFQVYFNTVGVANSLNQSQALFDLIYQAAGEVTSYGTFGRTTHAFMAPRTLGTLQGLVTTLLNQVTNLSDRPNGLIINGDLQGMKTRFGLIQFVQDLFIDARLKPVQAYVLANGTTKATTVAPTPPATVTVAAVASGSVASTSYWTLAYTTTPSYVYAVASCDAVSNESTLTYSAVATAITTGGANSLTIAPPAANDAYAFRVYRSGLGYAKTGGANTPYSFRWIGTLLANGSSNVTFIDYNATIPGGENIFLLDLMDQHNALDFRYLLPITKVELFAQSLFLPWAVVMIGALRVKVPKFHAYIKNFSVQSPVWNPLAPNN